MNIGENRQFGSVLVGVTGSLFIFRGLIGGGWSLILAGTSVICGAVACWAPQLLEYPRRLWLVFGELMNFLTQPLILGVIYFGIVTPLGLIRRCFGHSKIIKAGAISPSPTTYWVALDRNEKSLNWESMRRRF